MGKIKKYTYEEVEKLVSEISDCTLLSEEYHSMTEKLRFRCSCGEEFSTDLHHFLGQKQRQCQKCGRKKATSGRLLSLEEVKSRLSSVGCEYVSGEYKGRRSKLVVRCSCGHLKEISVNSATSGTFSGLCTDCSNEKAHDLQRLDIEDVKILAASKGLVLLSTEYKNAREPLLFQCSCGRTFSTSWDSIQTGKKSPHCDMCSQFLSKGAQKVESWLAEHNFHYEKEKVFPGCGDKSHPYRFDFYVPEKNLCIEYDGQQHYRIVDYTGTGDTEVLNRILWDTQCRDLAKEIFCKEHGIDLLRIPYFNAKNIETILSNTLMPR